MYKNTSKYLLILLLIFPSKVIALNPGAYLFRFNNPQTATQSSQITPSLPFNQPSTTNININTDFNNTSNLKIMSLFEFTISEISLDFKTITPETLLQKTHTLFISAPNTHGYSILGFQNHPLQLASSVTIPNWSELDNYGFGYSLDNTIFQSFPDQSRDQPPAIITSSDNGSAQFIPITYQIKIPSTQAIGDYQNTIYYLALPAY